MSCSDKDIFFQLARKKKRHKQIIHEPMLERINIEKYQESQAKKAGMDYNP